VSDSESLLSRLAAQLEKCESRHYRRDDHFESKRNADSGLYGQTQFIAYAARILLTKWKLLITSIVRSKDLTSQLAAY
jgi:hypothetical protein